MKFFKLIPFYIYWHYTKSIFEFIEFSKNMIWFVWNFFSIKSLILNFFTPYKKLGEKYNGGLNLEQFAESFIVTSLMRIMGMMFRSVIIFIGLIITFLTVLTCVTLFFVWLALPLIVLFLFIVVIYTLVNQK